jgi:hypothetical protein
MATPMMTKVEKAVGKRAPFKVYYRNRGKLRFDSMWATSADEASAKLLAFAKELGMGSCEIVRVESADENA